MSLYGTHAYIPLHYMLGILKCMHLWGCEDKEVIYERGRTGGGKVEGE